VYHLLSTKEAYNETVFHRCDDEALKRAQCRLRKQGAQLGFQLIPRAERMMFLGSRLTGHLGPSTNIPGNGVSTGLQESGTFATHLALSRVVLHKYTQFGWGKLHVAANCAHLQFGQHPDRRLVNIFQSGEMDGHLCGELALLSEPHDLHAMSVPTGNE
jgi:hypothetical protein